MTKIIRSLEFHSGTREEKLPGYSPGFPYIASRAELDFYRDRTVPWHWHRAVELFYMESGSLTYHTPDGAWHFPAGSGGMVNSDVLHMTEFSRRAEPNIQLLHIFDPLLIAGFCGSLIDRKYVAPLTGVSHPGIFVLSPEDPSHIPVLRSIRQAFRLSEDEAGYELKVRHAMSEIWLGLLELFLPSAAESYLPGVSSEKISPDRAEADSVKTMMIYIHEHFSEKISVAQLAACAYLSERDCYRVFQDCLHMTPVEYMKNYRLQTARRMLAEEDASVTDVGHACGFGSVSYFARLFRESEGCTPSEYRRRWHGENNPARKQENPAG